MALSRPAIGNIATSDWRYLSQRLAISRPSIGVISPSDWQYRDQRLALSLPAIDVLYNREQYYLFINRCPWPILLTWYAIKFQSKKRIIYAILFPLHPNQPSDRMYMFFTSTLQSFLVHKTSSCHSPHPTSMLICHFYNFQTTTRMTKNDLKRLSIPIIMT